MPRNYFQILKNKKSGGRDSTRMAGNRPLLKLGDGSWGVLITFSLLGGILENL